MRKILVSACLVGHRVRYDAGDVTVEDQIFLKWREEGRLVPLCPEVYGGLPTPRPDSQRVGQYVLTGAGVDVTAAYDKGAKEMVRLAKHHDVAFVILKENSPSCGSKFIYDGTFTDTKMPGQGLATEYLRESGFTVLSEEEMVEAAVLLAQIEAQTTTL